MNIEILEIKLKGLPYRELCERYTEHYGHVPASRNRPHLIKKILWAAQMDEYGDISEEARKKALAIADDRDIKERFQQKERPAPQDTAGTPKVIRFQPKDELLPGMILHRNYQDRNIQVLVLENGNFEWEGQFYKSLSAVARSVTGTRWSGPKFFGLRNEGGAE